MASEEQPCRRIATEVIAPPPEDWRDAVCRRPADRSRDRSGDRSAAPVDADAWNEVVRRRTGRS